VAMRVRMTHERAVHVEQGDTTKRAMSDAQRCRHCGPWLSGKRVFIPTNSNSAHSLLNISTRKGAI
jgi:hypothetical protein